MNLGPLDPVYRELYALTKEEESRPNTGSRIQAGHSFEDETFQAVYSRARECDLKALPPRQKLDLPTASGNQYQFDATFTHGGTFYLLECKRRQITAMEHVYYFASKVMDHRLALRTNGPRLKGIFLSSVEVGQSSLRFGFGFGLTIIDPKNPPLCELYARTSEKNAALSRAIGKLQDQLDSVDPLKLQSNPNPLTLLRSYEYLKRRV